MRALCRALGTASQTAGGHVGGQGCRPLRAFAGVVNTTGSRRPVKKGVVTPTRTVPDYIPKPPYFQVPNYVEVSQEQEDEWIRTGRLNFVQDRDREVGVVAASQIARSALSHALNMAEVGVTTDQIDCETHNHIVGLGACPSPLNFLGFPKSICTSVNEVLCHGIPDSRPLENGDVLKIDVSVFKDGYHGDCCATVIVGEGSSAAQKIVHATMECLRDAIFICGPNVPFNRIGKTIEKTARKHGFAVSPHFAGHGIGQEFHTLPWVFHFDNDLEGLMQPGMTFTIEPILVEKDTEFVMWDDGWTCATKDGGLAAQWEHTLVITDSGYHILTA